jgi:heptosyltransferase-2
MAIPAFRAVREIFPYAKIFLIVRPYVVKLVEGLPYFDAIIEYDPKGRDRGVRPYISIVKRLKKEQFDIAIILPNSFASAFIPFLSGIPQRIGYNEDGRGWLLTGRIESPREAGEKVPVPMVDRYMKICEYLNGKISPHRAQLVLSKGAEGKAKEIHAQYGIGEGERNVLITPGAAFGSSKLWKAEYFAQVADWLIERYRCKVLIAPGPGEEEIAKKMEESMKHNPVNLLDEIVPLDLLASLIKMSSLLITNDTGPRHLAFALERPAVVIMGPTDPRYSSCHVDEKTVILRKELDCVPCHLKQCPTDHRCMDLITPDEVFEASCRLLDGSQ